MDFLTQLFTEMSSRDSMLVLLFLGIAWLIGTIFGRMSKNGKIRKLKADLASKEQAYATLDNAHQTMTGQFKGLETDLKNANLAMRNAESRLNVVEEEKGRYQNEALTARNQIKKLNAEHELQTARVEELKGELAIVNQELETANNQVANFATTSSASTSTSHDANPLGTERNLNIDTSIPEHVHNYDTRSFTPQVEKEEVFMDDLTALQSTYANTRNRLDVLEAKMEQMLKVNSNLEAQLANASANNTVTTRSYENEGTRIITKSPSIPAGVSIEAEDSPEQKAAKARSALSGLMGSKIDSISGATKDDLKLVNGIGPFIEEKLNKIGIYTYRQISQFDNDIINLVTDAIQFFPGRIVRDEWVKQAKTLMSETRS